MPLKPETRALTVLLALLTGIGPFTVDIYIPSLPAIGAFFGASPAGVQATVTGYLIGFSLAQTFHGPLADRYGRRPVMMAALVLYVIAGVVCTLAPSLPVLIVARVLQAVGAAGPIILARAIIRDLFSGVRAGRELSIMASIMGIAPMIAPPLGGFLQQHFDWRASFVAITLVGVVMLVLVWVALPETLREPSRERLSPVGILCSFARIGRSPVFRAYATIVAFCYAGLLTYIAGSAFVMEGHYRLGPVPFGFAFTAGAAFYIIGTMSGRRAASRFGLDGAVGIGAACLAVGGVAILVGIHLGTGSVLEFLLPVLVMMIGVGIVIPQGIAAALTPFAERAGAASSFLGFIHMGAAAIAVTLSTTVFGDSVLSLAATCAFVGIGSLAVFLLSARARRGG